MAVSFVASSAVVTGANPTLSLPTGVVEKDLLLIITTGTATPTTPAGWTLQRAQAVTSFLTVFSKFATGTEAATLALTVAGTTSSAVMVAYRGASAIDSISGTTTATAATSITTGLTGNTQPNDCEISIYVGNNVAGAWTAPALTTTRVNSTPTAAVTGILIVDEQQAAAGNSTARTATIAGAHTLSSVAISVIPSGRYWVGGTGTWTTTTTNWSQTSGGASGAPAPTANDPVFFDQAATYTVTLTGALTCFGMTVSAGTVTFSSTGTIANSGSMSLSSSTVWSATGVVTFNSTSTGRTVTTNGVTINSPITFDGVAGAWSLGSALSTGVTLTTTLNNGTLTLNGFNLTTGIFSSSVATARSIAFGSNNIVLSHTTAATTVLNMATATLFTTTSTTGGFTATAAITRTYVFGTTGGSATNAPSLSLTGSGTAVQTLTTASWFKNLSFGSTAFNPGTTALNIAGSLTLSSGGTFTTVTPTMVGTGTLTSNTNTTLAALTINSTAGTITLGAAFSMAATGTVTLTAGTLDLGGFDLTTGIFSSSVATARSIAFGTNNIVLAHTTAATTVLSMATATGFTWTGTTGGFTATAAITRTYTFGTTGGTAANAPNLSLTLSGTAVQTFTTASWFNTLSFGSTAFNPGTTALNLNGLTLSSGGTFTTLSATMVGTGTITTSGKTIAALTVNNGAGTVTLSGALGATTYTQTAGNVNFGSNNLSCSGAAAYSAGTLTNIATITCTTWTVNGAFTLSQGTITPSTSFVLTSGSFTYSGGTLSPVPTFTHTAGTVTLGQNYSLTSTGTYTLVAGTLDMTDRNLTAAAFITSGTGVRAINFGTSGYGEITVTGNNTTIWDGGGAGITYTGTPRIYASYTGSVGTRTVNLGTAWTEATAFDVTVQGSSYYFVSGFQILSTGGNPTDTVAISGVAKAFNMVNFSFAVTPGAMTIYGDYNIPSVIYTGTINASASTTTFAATTTQNIQIDRAVDLPITFNGVGGTFTLNASTTGGSTKAMTLTAGALVVNGSSAISTGTFVSTGTTTRSINFNSNNITLTNATAATTVLSMADATNFTIAGSGGFISDLAVTKTFSFGSTAGGSAANAPNLTFTTGAAIPTITTGSWFNSLNFGSTTSTPALATISVGTLTLASGGTYTGLTPIFTSTQTWTPQFSKQLAAIGVNIPGGTLTLGGSQSLVGTTASTLTAGTLDLGGYDLNAGSFASSNTNTRSIVFGTNNIILTPAGAGSVLSMADATNFTLTASTGGFVSNLAVARSFQFGSSAGGTATNAPNLTITSGAAIPTITTNSWFNALNFTGTTSTPAAATVFVSTLTLATGGTYIALTPIFTRTQTWTTQFSKQLGGIGFNLAGGTLTLGDSPSLVATSTTTLTNGTLDLGGFNLTTGIFSSTNTNTRSIVFGSNNIILSHTTAAQTVLSMAIATGFTYTGTGGFTTDASVTRTCVFGTTGGSATNAPNLSLTGTGVAIVTLTTGSWFNNLSFGSTAFALAATTLNIGGNLTLSTVGTFTSLTLNMVGTGTILSNAKPILALTINNVSGTTTLGDSLTLGATAATTLTSGNLALNGFTLTTGTFVSTNTNTRSIAFGTGNIVLATTTAAAVNLSMADATNFTYTTSGTFESGTGCFQATMSVTRTFTFGTTSASGTAANAPILYLVSGASIPTITTGSWFREINFGTTAFTIAATNLNLTNVVNGSSTSVLTALTATMVATGTIRSTTSIGPVIVNTAGITTTFYNGGTSRCTTLTVTQGTVFLDTNAVLICSSTCTLNTAGTLDMNGQIQCTTFTIAGATYSVSSTCSWIISTSVVITSGTLNVNYSSAGGLGAAPLFTHTAGTVNFNTSYALTATGTYTFTAGTLNINDGVTLSTGIFSSTNANTRTINFGITTSPGYIALTHTTAATVVLSMAIVTGLTVNALGKWDGSVSYAPTQNAGGFVSNTAVTKTFTCGTTGGNSANAPCLTVYGTGATQLPTFTTASWFGDFNIYNLSTMTIAATTLNINSLFGAGYYFSLNTTSLSLNFVGSGFINYQGDTNNTFGILGTVTINHAGTTAMVYAECCATTVAFTAGTLETRYWVNGGFNGYGSFKVTGTFTQTGGTWYNNFIYITSCATYTINGPTINFNDGSITATTSLVLTSGSFTYGGTATLSAVPLFTHTAGTVTFNKDYALATASTYTLTAGTLTLADGIVLSTGVFSSTNTNTRSLAFGSSSAGNINLTHTTATTVVLSMAILTGFSYTGPGGFTVADMANTRTFTYGTTGGSTTNAVNLTFTTGASIATLTTASWYKNLNFGTTTFNPGTTTLNIVSSLTLSATGTYPTLTPTPQANVTYTFNGASIGPLTSNSTFIITLGSAGGCTTFAMSSGTFDFASYTLTCSSTATYTGGTFVNGPYITCTTFTLNGPTFSLTTGTINPSVSFVLTTGAFTYGGTATLGATPLFTHTAGTATFNKNYALTVTGTYTLTAGTLTLADGVTMSTGIFSSTGAGVRSIAFGSISAGNINLTHTTAATTVLNMGTATGLSYTGTGGFTADASVARTFGVGSIAGGSLITAPSLTFTTGTSVATLVTGSWFDNLNFGTTSFNPGTTALNIAGDLTLSATGTYTTMTPTLLSTGTVTSNTNTTLGALTINSTSGTTTLASALTMAATGTTTLTSGALVLGGYDLSTGIFSSSGAVARSIAFGPASLGSVSFNGTSQYLTLPSNAALNVGSGDFTVECWIYLNSAPTAGQTQEIFNSGDFHLNFRGSANLAITNNTTVLSNLSNTIATSSWTHVAAVRVSDTMTIYLNGVANTPATGQTYSFVQGAGQIGSQNGASGPFLNGYISNLRVVKGTAVYTGAFTPPLQPLTAIQNAGIYGTNTSAITGTQTSLLLNTPANTSFITDSSSNSITVTNNGTATAAVLNPFNSVPLGSVYVNGTTTQYLTVADASAFAFGTGTFTVEGWFYFTSVPTNSGLWHLGASNFPGLTGLALAWFSGTNSWVVYAGNGSNFAVGAGTLITNSWMHLALVRDSSNILTLYVNGIGYTVVGSPGDLTDYSNLTNLVVGGYYDPSYTMNGYISNFRITKGVSVYTGSSFTLPTGLLSSTQPANVNGTPTAAITGTQTSLLLNTAYGSSFLTDSSTYNLTVGSPGSTSSKLSPYRNNINLTHTTAATTVLNMATATGFTYTGTGGFVVAAMSNTRTFNFGATAGGSLTTAPSLTFTTGASVATLTTASWFDNLDFGTTTFNPGTTALNITGDLTLSATGTYTTMTPTLLGTGTITGNTNTTLAALTINSTSGTTTLASALTMAATGTTTLTSGALVLGGYDLSTGIFASTNTNTRSVSFGSTSSNAIGSVSLNGTTQYLTVPGSSAFAFGTDDYTVELWAYPTSASWTTGNFYFWDILGGNVTLQYFQNQISFYNATLGAASPVYNSGKSLPLNTWAHIAIVRQSGITKMFVNGIFITSAADSFNVTTPGTVYVGVASSLTAQFPGYLSDVRMVKGVAVYTGSFVPPTGPLGSTQTANVNGNPSAAITGTQTSLLLNTAYGSSFLTDSSTYNLSVTNVGTATSLKASPYRNNINLTHTTAATTVLNMATATSFTLTGTGGFTATAAITRTYVFGTTGGSAAISPNLWLTGSGTAIATITTASWFNLLDFGSTAFTIAATALNLNGLTLSTGGTFTNLTPTMVGTGTITTNGKTLPALTVNTAGTATLASALTLSGALTLTQGTLASSTYPVTSATFASTGTATRSIIGSGTYTISGAGATAFSNASATGITITGLIISMTAATAKTFAGGGGSYSTLNQGGAGALTISGDNSFSDLTATTRPSTITFTASSTQTFADFTLSGVLGSLVTINSSTPGTQTTLSKASGTVSVGYLSIRDSIATGGAGWYAGTTSTNVSNNLGWIFTAPPAPGSVYLGNFFAFF